MAGPPPSVEAMIERRLASERSTGASMVNENAIDSATTSDSQDSIKNTLKTPSKSRSLSDSTPQLSPSPKFREPNRTSKDDHHIASHPRTPRRPDFLSRGLSLQVPPSGTLSGMPSPALFAHRVPLSPQLDARNTYATPAPLLPRRSRGAEFSRACTHLHHSTLADQSSPDSSPTITQKGMMIPSRKGRSNSNSMAMDSPNMGAHSAWPAMGVIDRTAASSSVGSINMLGDESSSTSSDECDPMDPDEHDDPMIMTPQAMKASQGRASTPIGSGPWANMFSPVGPVPNFMSIQRARLRKGRSRKSSSSASGHSSLASPGPGSPPGSRHMEGGNGYFAKEAVMRKDGSRRESLSLFTNDLHISSGNDSGDEAASAVPTTPGVVRRPVTRRGNLLPKSRQFGRIKAELLEESAPIDSEVRREAEIIRQVRESDEVLDPRSHTAQSSPSLLPTVPGLDGPLEGVPEETSDTMSLDSSLGRRLSAAFNINGGRPMGGRGSWNPQDIQSQTPPPPAFARASSSAISEDVNMDSPSNSLPTNTAAAHDQSTNAPWFTRAATPQPIAPITAVEGLKKSNKRRRDDDLDVNSIKRRAVSPGVSVQNSPILSQSPSQRDSGWWGNAPKTSREGSNGGHAERSASVSTTPSLGPKRIGLQGMTDTSDGFMKMSIE